MGLLSNKIEKRDDLKAGDHIYSWRHSYIYAHHGIYAGDDKIIHFTRGGGQEIGTGTILDRVVFSSSPSHPVDNPCPRCGDQSKLDGVISSCIDCFLSGGDLYLFEYGVSPALFLAKVRGGTCTLAKSDPVDDVLHRASFLLQNGFGVYNIFMNNCEDFAIYCKTGLLVITSLTVGRSGQAASFLAAVNAIVLSPRRYLTTSFSGLASPLRYLTTSFSGLTSPVCYLTTSFSGLTAVGCGMYCVGRLVSDIGVRGDVAKVPVASLIACSSLERSDAETESSEAD